MFFPLVKVHWNSRRTRNFRPVNSYQIDVLRVATCDVTSLAKQYGSLLVMTNTVKYKLSPLLFHSNELVQWFPNFSQPVPLQTLDLQPCTPYSHTLIATRKTNVSVSLLPPPSPTFNMHKIEIKSLEMNYFSLDRFTSNVSGQHQITFEKKKYISGTYLVLNLKLL